MKTKQILLLAFTALGMVLSTYAQQLKVGSNPTTIDASSVFEAESTTKGLLPPRMTTAQRDAIANPAKGLVLYNTTLDCLQINKGTAAVPTWECIGASAVPTVAVNCSTAGFNTGTYVSGTSVGSATYTVTITNNSFSSVSLTNNISDLSLTGVSGVSVLSVAPATLNLNAAQSGTITYTLQGTPTGCGTLQGVWTKLSLTCTKTVTVNPNISCATGSWTTAIAPSVAAGLINGTAYTGTYSIPYTGGGCTLPPESLTQSGLTLSFAGGSIGATGNLVYNLSGIYTGTSGAFVTFTTSSGCSVVIGIARSCNEIKLANSAATDGVYWIDPDGAGSVPSFQVLCDMTRNGGGWTLVLKSMANNSDFLYSSAIWASGSTFNASDFTISSSNTSNALYNSYNHVLATNVWVDFVTTPDLTPYTVTSRTPKALATGTELVSVSSTICKGTNGASVPATFYTPGNAYSIQAGIFEMGCNLIENGSFASVRFGIIANESGSNLSPDSGVGIGVIGSAGVGPVGSGVANNVQNVDCGEISGSNSGFLKALLWVK